MNQAILNSRILSLGFKLYDMVHRKQQTITRSIKDVLEGKSMQN